MARPRPLPVDSLPPTAPPLVQVRDLEVQYRVAAVAPPSSRSLPRDLPDLARIMFGAVAPRSDAVLRAVDDVSFHIKEGETLGLVGESGCGKSTLGRALVQLERPRRGSVLIGDLDVQSCHGAKLKRLRRTVQMIFQDPYASLNPRMTVGEIVTEPMAVLGTEPSVELRLERARELLELCGLERGMIRRYPHELSGGQRQRIAIARALAPSPRVIVADEPVSALDVSIQAQILNLLGRLQSELKLTMLFISHDLAVVRHVSQRIAVMYLGRIVETGPAASLTDAPLHPYTRALLAAVPNPDPVRARQQKLSLLEGDVPSPLTPPPGCAFHTRCVDVVARCRKEAPLLKLGRLARPVACHVAHDEV
jgi:oligopeptide transport system ATP-binding protein